MSTRWYPIYQKGNPQLRIFLTNFWMKMARPDPNQPENIVKFITPTQMSDHDIKQYLEKIYQVPVADVRSKIMEGKFRRVPQKGYIIKDECYRQAYVTMPPNCKFKFPDVTSNKAKREDDDMKKYEKTMKESYEKFQKKNAGRPGVPGWFGL
ncbi:ribosomal protein L23 [Nesidiocoris tenuis]|uniref:Large ribosomal subunit protein uL23m n=1 Tax=Nesidiocoris tenuis TaxID=355587 RepID=A0ABN7BGF3_9HEMI|nr:ribosomal protein L23 [Nesidiocoris tenuis]